MDRSLTLDLDPLLKPVTPSRTGGTEGTLDKLTLAWELSDITAVFKQTYMSLKAAQRLGNLLIIVKERLIV